MVLNIPSVDHRNIQIQSRYFFCIIQSRIPFAIINTSCNHNDIRTYLHQLLQVCPPDSSRGDLVDVCSGPESRFSGSPYGHIVNQTVYCHPESPRSAAGGQKMFPFEFSYAPRASFRFSMAAFNPMVTSPSIYACGSKPLSHEAREKRSPFLQRHLQR